MPVLVVLAALKVAQSFITPSVVANYSYALKGAIDNNAALRDRAYRNKKLNAANNIMAVLQKQGLTHFLPASYLQPEGSEGEVVTLFETAARDWGWGSVRYNKESLYDPNFVADEKYVSEDEFYCENTIIRVDERPEMVPLLDVYVALRQIAVSSSVSVDSRRSACVFLRLVDAVIKELNEVNNGALRYYKAGIMLRRIHGSLNRLISQDDNAKMFGLGSAYFIKDNKDSSYWRTGRSLTPCASGPVLTVLSKEAEQCFQRYADESKEHISKGYVAIAASVKEKTDTLLFGLLQQYGVKDGLQKTFGVRDEDKRVKIITPEPSREEIYTLYHQWQEAKKKGKVTENFNSEYVKGHKKKQDVLLSKMDENFINALRSIDEMEREITHIRNLASLVDVVGLVEIAKVVPLLGVSMENLKNLTNNLQQVAGQAVQHEVESPLHQFTVSSAIENASDSMNDELESLKLLQGFMNDMTGEQVTKAVLEQLDNRVEAITQYIASMVADKKLSKEDAEKHSRAIRLLKQKMNGDVGELLPTYNKPVDEEKSDERRRSLGDVSDSDSDQFPSGAVSEEDTPLISPAAVRDAKGEDNEDKWANVPEGNQSVLKKAELLLVYLQQEDFASNVRTVFNDIILADPPVMSKDEAHKAGETIVEKMQKSEEILPYLQKDIIKEIQKDTKGQLRLARQGNRQFIEGFGARIDEYSVLIRQSRELQQRMAALSAERSAEDYRTRWQKLQVLRQDISAFQDNLEQFFGKLVCEDLTNQKLQREIWSLKRGDNQQEALRQKKQEAGRAYLKEMLGNRGESHLDLSLELGQIEKEMTKKELSGFCPSRVMSVCSGTVWGTADQGVNAAVTSVENSVEKDLAAVNKLPVRWDEDLHGSVQKALNNREPIYPLLEQNIQPDPSLKVPTMTLMTGPSPKNKSSVNNKKLTRDFCEKFDGKTQLLKNLEVVRSKMNEMGKLTIESNNINSVNAAEQKFQVLKAAVDELDPLLSSDNERSALRSTLRNCLAETEHMIAIERKRCEVSPTLVVADAPPEPRVPDANDEKYSFLHQDAKLQPMWFSPWKNKESKESLEDCRDRITVEFLSSVLGRSRVNVNFEGLMGQKDFKDTLIAFREAMENKKSIKNLKSNNIKFARAILFLDTNFKVPVSVFGNGQKDIVLHLNEFEKAMLGVIFSNGDAFDESLKSYNALAEKVYRSSGPGVS